MFMHMDPAYFLFILPALALCAGCALPVVSAGTFLPAGDLQKGEMQASLSMEAGRVLAGPSDVPGNTIAPETSKWEVLTWVGSDASLRWQINDTLTGTAGYSYIDRSTNGQQFFVNQFTGSYTENVVFVSLRKSF